MFDPHAAIAWCIRERRRVLARESHRLDHHEVRQGLYDLLAEEVLIRTEHQIFEDSELAIAATAGQKDS